MNAIQIYIAVALAAISALGGWKLHGWKDAADREAYERGAAKAMEAAAAEIAKIDVKAVTINRKIEREVRENTVFTDCRVTDDGMRLLREAYGEPAADGKLPTTGGTDRPDDGGEVVGRGSPGNSVPAMP